MKQLLAYLVAAVALAPSGTYALGLGKLQPKSRLNQPFSAIIELIGAKAEELDSLGVKLADTERFRRAGIDRSYVLSQLRFEVVRPERGPDYIKISSHDPIREPFLSFLIEVNWPKGQLFREYTVLLDPPGYESAPRVSGEQPGARLPAMPGGQSAELKGRMGEAEARPSLRAERPPRPTYTPGGSYGPTRRGDTLWAIARRVRPDASVSVQQTMLGLLRANPQAFFLDENINALRQGVVLSIPEASTLGAASEAEALAQVQRHYALWDGYRQGSARSLKPQPIGGASSQGTVALPKAPVLAEQDEAQLKLLSAADQEKPASPGAGGSKSGKGTEQDLALTTETLDSQRQENTELKAKLGQADGIIKLLQRQIEVKDEELAALQSKLGTLESQAPSEPIQAMSEAPKPELTSPAPPSTEASNTPPAAPQAVAGAERPPAETTPALAATDTSQAQRAPGELSPPKPATAARPQAAPGLFESLPGGAATASVAAVLLAAGLALFLMRRGREEPEIAFAGGTQADLLRKPALKPAAKKAPLVEDEPASVATVPPSAPVRAADATQELDLAPVHKAQEAAPELAEEDPLAEVNVYLAYERFDQAEELVKQAIQSEPREHKYKLRLLEVYYSSGNQAAYEEYAKVLYEAVGGAGPLWDSAVAMWHEMSPERALFESPGEEAAQRPRIEPRELVDITGVEEGAAVEFDLEPAMPAEAASGDSTLAFDLLTGGADAAAPGGILDITADEGQGVEAGTEFLDVTAFGAEQPLSAAATTPPSQVFDITAGSEEENTGVDLLDVTATSDIATSRLDGVLDLGSPGLLGPAEGSLEDLDLVIGEEQVLDVTGAASAHAKPSESVSKELHILDFTLSPDAQTVRVGPPQGAEGAQLGADRDLGVEFDLSDTAFDELLPETSTDAADHTVVVDPSHSGASQLAIDSTAGDAPLSPEADSLSIDDEDHTLDTLDELAQSLEDSIAGGDPIAVDLDLEGGIAADFASEDTSYEETLRIAMEGLEEDLSKAEGRRYETEQTAETPPPEPMDESAVSDETETKLSLAKAYAELGDVEGARTILEDVVREGNEAQRREAQQLLKDLG